MSIERCPKCVALNQYNGMWDPYVPCAEHGKGSRDCYACQQMNLWNDISEHWKYCGNHRPRL